MCTSCMFIFMAQLYVVFFKTLEKRNMLNKKKSGEKRSIALFICLFKTLTFEQGVGEKIKTCINWQPSFKYFLFFIF